jgi:CubicO group peptidase (beta-lactamase class C family)
MYRAARGVPGASAGVLIDGQLALAADGILSTATQVAANTDTVFQIGSITKLWTTTLVMQLLDDGLISLDEPLRTFLPEFVLADEAAAARVTIRHLLTHTSGFEGDLFTDTGQGEDALEKYVATLASAAQVFAPGAMFSYNNTGFSVLGRLIEKLRGQPFDEVLIDRIARPLGLDNVCPSPFQAILRRAAVGHLDGPDGPEAAPLWALARSNAPAGAMLAMTAHDLLAFARMHLDGGQAPDGTGILSPTSVAAMQQDQVTVPPTATMGDAWGLGWSIDHNTSGQVVHHDGGTIGQAAFLRVVPERGLAVALLTNGGDFMGLYADVVEPLLDELAGIAPRVRLVPPATPAPIDLDYCLGTYCDTIYDITVTAADGRIWLERIPKDVLSEQAGEKPIRTELIPASEHTLIAQEETHGLHAVYVFVNPDGGDRASHIHYGRAVRRADSPLPNSAPHEKVLP